MKKSVVLTGLVLIIVTATFAQSITTGSIMGKTFDAGNRPVAGVNLMLMHQPSGIQYGTTSNSSGRFSFDELRIGGPYQLYASHIGYTPHKVENIYVVLGSTLNLELVLEDALLELDEVVVINALTGGINPSRTGASVQISNHLFNQLPTISRKISDFTRLTPQFKGNSYMGQSILMNHYTIDGSSFNNSFGLASQPGERTEVAPVSLESLDQIQVNVASYDVRQSDFIGASVNMVTRSGSNHWQAAYYGQGRSHALVGKNAANATFDPGAFTYAMGGGYLSGPVVKDKLFFFASFELENNLRPATSFLANDGTQPVEGNTTRVFKSDLEELRSFLINHFGYDPGDYERYNFSTSAMRFIGKLDYNLNLRNKISIRYNHLSSSSDLPISNHYVLGFGFRRGSVNSLNFQHSNYAITENIRSIVAKWNNSLRANMTNSLVLGYRFHDETRVSSQKLFPLVDILKDGTTYTSFGTEPFSPYAGVRYGSLQLQNNLSWLVRHHHFLFGFNLEHFTSEDNFFPGAQSVYVYNSLDDFYTDAHQYLANPGHSHSSVNLRRFQVRYSNIPGIENPLQRLSVTTAGMYFQDRWEANKELNLTFGMRIDVPFFRDTGYDNNQASGLGFMDEMGATVRYSTKKLPNSNPLFSPRFGFNWNAGGRSITQLRGGSGLFASQPPYVIISNQVGNNGTLTGYEELTGTESNPLYRRPFNPDINAYKPTHVTGQPSDFYELALVDPDFRFPQVWRSSLAVDQVLPWEILATVEFIYDRDVNGIRYINANLPQPDSYFPEPDNRPRWSGGNRIHQNIANAVVLKNDNKGYAWNIAAVLERNVVSGLFMKAGYSFGESKNITETTPIAYVSWGNNAISGHPNQPGLSYSLFSPGHRTFAALIFRSDIFRTGNTVLALFLDRYSTGRSSYTYAGDLNGDGSFGNDLIYIPANLSEMNFQEYTVNGQTFTTSDQAAAWEAYINQDTYLKTRRGKYAERFGVVLPYVIRGDLSLSQEMKSRFFGKKHALIIRFDVINFTNLLYRYWGVGKIPVTSQPLMVAGQDASGKPLYHLWTQNGELISQSFIRTATLNDVYQMQFSIKYLFNH